MLCVFDSPQQVSRAAWMMGKLGPVLDAMQMLEKTELWRKPVLKQLILID